MRMDGGGGETPFSSDEEKLIEDVEEMLKDGKLKRARDRWQRALDAYYLAKNTGHLTQDEINEYNEAHAAFKKAAGIPRG